MRTRHHLSGAQPPQAEMSCSPLFTRTVAVSRPLHGGFPGASPAEIARHVTVCRLSFTRIVFIFRSFTFAYYVAL